MRSEVLDLYFTHAPSKRTAPRGTASRKPCQTPGHNKSAVQWHRRCHREEGDRRATAEHGEYTAADGKFVMSGGKPTIFDASEGTTTGRQLTFFLADATIIVDSGNGSRTLTKHRVEK